MLPTRVQNLGFSHFWSSCSFQPSCSMNWWLKFHNCNPAKYMFYWWEGPESSGVFVKAEGVLMPWLNSVGGSVWRGNVGPCCFSWVHFPQLLANPGCVPGQGCLQLQVRWFWSILGVLDSLCRSGESFCTCPSTKQRCQCPAPLEFIT